MIYYNRGVDQLAEQRFAEALADNAKALRLDAVALLHVAIGWRP